MGYTTEFTGGFNLSKPATEEQATYLNTFSQTRRMKRDPEKLKAMFNGEHGLNGEYGIDGEYFAKDDGNFGQRSDDSVVEFNEPPSTQPGLWCQWALNEDLTILEWDGGEKFYNYTEWLKYLIEHFFSKWDILLNGKVKWQGEDMDDRGLITVTDNVISVVELE